MWAANSTLATTSQRVFVAQQRRALGVDAKASEAEFCDTSTVTRDEQKGKRAAKNKNEE